MEITRSAALDLSVPFHALVESKWDVAKKMNSTPAGCVDTAALILEAIDKEVMPFAAIMIRLRNVRAWQATAVLLEAEAEEARAALAVGILTAHVH